MPYVSKCAAWPDIQASHNSGTVQLELEDLYGILGFLCIGLGAGAVAIILEFLWYRIGRVSPFRLIMDKKIHR